VTQRVKNQRKMIFEEESIRKKIEDTIKKSTVIEDWRKHRNLHKPKTGQLLTPRTIDLYEKDIEMC
jgi:hypothetical protein